MPSLPILQSLRHRPFAFLWFGQTISRLGDSIYRVALAWWVLEKTGSAAAMGTVLVFTTVPLLIFVLLGGVMVDRVDRVRLMLASDLVRGVAVGLAAVLGLTGHLELWHVYVLSILFGLVDAFFQPAYVALVPQVTPAELRPSANSLTSLSGQVTGILGPALAAAVVALGSTSLAFVLDTVSFVLSAACLVPLVGMVFSRGPVTKASGNVWKELREGLAVVVHSPWLWVTIAIASLANITLSGPMGVALPFLVKEFLHSDVGVLGLLTSMNSVGYVVGAVALGNLPRLRWRGLLAYGSWVVASLMLVLMGIVPSVPVAAAAMLLMGASFSVFGLIWTHTLQELVPTEMLGRVASLDYLGSYLFLPVGYAISGWVTDQTGPAAVFLFGGIITAVLSGLGLLHPAIRKLD